jgi:arsenate reductase
VESAFAASDHVGKLQLKRKFPDRIRLKNLREHFMKKILSAITGTTLLIASTLTYGHQSSDLKQITFVCEHGVAKSVIAAAHFNKLAEQKGLRYRAIASGTEPENILQPATAVGLAKDGLEQKNFLPHKVSAMDEATSRYIVTIGIDQEPAFLRTAKLREWDGVPAVSKDYNAARSDLVKRVEALLLELESK